MTSENKLFCTFLKSEQVDNRIEYILDNYTLTTKYIFHIKINDTDEDILTYNIDFNNVSLIPKDTIITHRKKESNTLYTINALNVLIHELNGTLDKNYKINWFNYKNTALLIRDNTLNIFKTKLIKMYKF